MINFKTLIALCILLVTTTVAKGQTYGNEWIDYSQTYYSFKIVQDGIYRLDYTTLEAAGIPLGSFQSANIQLFGKQREIPIHVNDGGDNSIDSGDYILFYAEKNDGWLDSAIYSDPNTIGNPSYSLYNDTLQYFFTWNSSTNNKRYIIESATDFVNYPNATSYITSVYKKSYNLEYHEGVKLSQSSSSFYTPGEGWGNYKINGVNSGGYTANLTAATPLPYTGAGAPNATFRGLSVSNSNATPISLNHHMSWQIGASNTTLLDTSFAGYQQIICNKQFSSSLLSNGNTTIKWNIIDDLGAATDFQAYSYYSVTYPRLPDFAGSNNISFTVQNDVQGKIRLDISNAGYASPLMLVLGDTPRIVPFVPNGGVHSALIPNCTNGVDQTVIYKDYALLLNVGALTPVNAYNTLPGVISGKFTDFLSTGIENALIMICHQNLSDATMNYASYRQSATGGNYTTVMGNVDEIYQQFGGGIEKHIIGIRRFAHYLYNNTTNKPVGLFLLGKGIRESTYNLTTNDGPGTRKDSYRFRQSLIPSFGQPSSDVCITAGLEGSYLWSPLMSTGRISARSNSELQAYLDKVKVYEQQQDPLSVYDSPSKDWQKQILHFAGGSDADQQLLFQNYMNQMENKIEDSLFGGNVHRVYKTSSDPLDPTILTGITDRIADGVSLMSYFGHATATNSGFEINLDDAANWNNEGRYPVMLVNSCYNGNIFQLLNSKSEEFVQVPTFGAIAYIAAVGIGFDIYLNQYSQRLYKQFSTNNYGANLGEMMKFTIESLEAPGNLYKESTCTQMVLNGDPMLKLNFHERPEIELTAPGVYFTPDNIDLTTDSIEIHIVLTNLGRSIVDTFPLRIERTFPASSVDSSYIFLIPELHYKDTFSFKMPLQPNIAIGQNIFNIWADIPSEINEQYDEINNNQLTVSLYINIDGIVPVIPYEFAVVPEDSVTLRASTIDPVADFETYRFEIDTVDFEGTVPQSGQYRYAHISGYGGVKEVNPSD
ncbi:MAG: hypothetical protein JKY09_05415, partial [Crocinitomicaceae bacterium]|nr:hypothetical protein [Crocinitomicaceae bacterium]